jgi:predicted dehydrogenase
LDDLNVSGGITMRSEMNRRGFVKSAVAAGAAMATAASARRVMGANARVRVGFIGCGNRGDQVLDAFLKHNDAEVVAVCDLYEPYRKFAAQKVGTGCEQYKDYRRLLERKDIVAVVVATPDHWHAIIFCEACLAGKDVYVEKPASLTVAEGRRMVEIARKTGRVTQVGIQRRSSAILQEGLKIVREGGIGKVTVVRAFHILNEAPMGIGNPPDGDPPEGFDWNTWLGPAPKVPYNPNRCFYRFRWYWPYSGGQLTNFGTHYLDLIQAGLGKDYPLAVTALGGKFGNMDNREIPDTLEVLWEYEGGTLVAFSQYNCNAAPAARQGALVEFRGTNGTLYISYGGYEIVPEELRTEPVLALNPLDRRKGLPSKPAMEAVKASGKGITSEDTDHARNFLDCVKSRKPCNCDIEIGHRSTSATLLGKIAYQTKSYLQWDGKKERFTNNDAANQLLAYEYRAPWKLP